MRSDDSNRICYSPILLLALERPTIQALTCCTTSTSPTTSPRSGCAIFSGSRCEHDRWIMGALVNLSMLFGTAIVMTSGGILQSQCFRSPYQTLQTGEILLYIWVPRHARRWGTPFTFGIKGNLAALRNGRGKGFIYLLSSLLKPSGYHLYRNATSYQPLPLPCGEHLPTHV